MEAMIDNGEEWMQPLLDFRDFLVKTQDPATKHQYRDARRRTGKVTTWVDENNKERLIWGPYKFEFRKDLLRRLLSIQKLIQDKEDAELELIDTGELHEIRRLWRTEAGDWEDSVPKIFREVFGRDLAWKENDEAIFDQDSAALLESVCEELDLPSALVRDLIGVEQEMAGLARRSNIFKRIEQVLEKDWRSEAEVFEALNLKFEIEDDELVEEADNVV
jgi:DNA sulfur modification protein DndC